jgi:plastocyanin
MIVIMRRCAEVSVRAALAVIIGIVACILPSTMEAGTIKGIVRLKGGPVPQNKVPITIDQYVCGKETVTEDLVVSPDRGIRNAVVSLQTPPPGAKWETTASPAKIDQKQCVFVPRVIVTPAGGTVDFLSSDPLLHNIHGFGQANPTFNRAQPKGRKISIVFKAPEIVRVDCDLHSWMRTWVVVAEHPYYAVTGDRGDFVLENVPPGKHTIRIWQERLRSVTQEVTVADTGVSTVTVEMSRP